MRHDHFNSTALATVPSRTKPRAPWATGLEGSFSIAKE